MVSGMGLRWASFKVVEDGIPMGRLWTGKRTSCCFYMAEFCRSLAKD